VKSAAGWCTPVGNGYRMAYTARMTAPELAAQAAAIRRAPVIAQPYLDKAYELRVTIAGSAVIACRIDSQASPRSEVDWRRYDFARVRHECVELDDTVVTALRRFMRAAELDFAAVDLVVRPDGSTVFLEANPSGQFLWLEALTGAGIVKAVANLLLDGDSPP
jgi:glutathione synthase/RimK-type ligase-like ATP-grasp enzyme